MTFELYKDKSDTSPPQRESFLNKITSSFITPKIPKTYCTYELHISSIYHPNIIFPADVRMRYQNDTMVLPACAAPGNHLEGRPEFCTLKAFAETVKEFTPTDWEGECAK